LNPGPALYEIESLSANDDNKSSSHRESQHIAQADNTTDNDRNPLKSEVVSEVTHEVLREVPPELAGIVTAWPSLPEHIKAAVLALISTVKA